MTHIQVQHAKAKLSEMLERAEHGETIIVTKHGKATAAIIGIDEYEQLKPHLFKNTWQALREDTRPTENPFEPDEISDKQTDLLFARDRTTITPRIDFEDLLAPQQHLTGLGRLE
jgi:prevent-host-death family protein